MSHVPDFEKALNLNFISFEKVTETPSVFTGEVYNEIFTILGDSKDVTMAKTLLLHLQTYEVTLNISRKSIMNISTLVHKYKVTVIDISPIKFLGFTLFYKVKLKGHETNLGGLALNLHYSK